MGKIQVVWTSESANLLFQTTCKNVHKYRSSVILSACSSSPEHNPVVMATRTGDEYSISRLGHQP